MPSSSVEQDNGAATAAAAAVDPSRPAIDERLISSLRTQAEVDFLCQKHGVPSVYNPRPAGYDRRAWTPLPAGSICVYAHALEAGMRIPLQGFFCEVLAHFGIAPAQLAPNGWRVMAGFIVLCRSVGVPPSVAVFRRFFVLAIINHKQKGWYCFRARDGPGLRFTGMPNTPMDWRRLFFFLSSPEPWPCPVEWGEPSKSSFLEPVLIGEEKKSEEKLMGAYGGGATVDIKTCLGDGNLAGAMLTAASTPPAAASYSIRFTSSSKGMDPSVYNMMKAMLAEKAAGKKVKGEASTKALSKKRCLEQAKGDEGPAPSVLLNTLIVCSPPPGFPRKPRHFPSRNRGDSTDWKAAQALLQGAVAPPQERLFSASKPSDVVKSGYTAILQAVNYTSFSLSYALELEEKLVARDAEVAALRGQLEDAKAELAAVKWMANGNVELPAAKQAAAEAEPETAGNENAESEHALEGYERWRDNSSAHVTASPPTTSTPSMQPGGGHKRRPSSKYDPKQWVL
ncbi:unnamed protein product [Alopecurus aequalis]